MGDTRFGAGLADGTDGDGDGVGREAASRAVDRLDGSSADFCQVFASVENDLEGVLAGVRAVVGDDTPLVGASTGGGEFVGRETTSGGVSVGVVSSDRMEFHTGLGTDLSADVAGAVGEAVDDLPLSTNYPYRAAVNLHDGLAGVSEQVAVQTRQHLGHTVEFAGGAAGDDGAMEETYVFEGGRVESDAVALALVGSDVPIPITANHGHFPISDPLTVTSAEGNVVHELDGRPAFEVWREHVEELAAERYGRDLNVTAELEAGDEELADLFAEYNLGIDQGPNRGYKIRWPGMTDSTDGPITCTTAVPEGTVVRIMHSPPDKQIESAREAARDVLSTSARAPGIDPDRVAGAFVYDCSCRDMILGDGFVEAVRAMNDEFDAPLAGFETYGELCMERSEMSGYHNTTSVLMVIPE